MDRLQQGRPHLQVVLHKAGLDSQRVASSGQVYGFLHEPNASLPFLSCPGLYQPELRVLMGGKQTLLTDHTCRSKEAEARHCMTHWLGKKQELEGKCSASWLPGLCMTNGRQ